LCACAVVAEAAGYSGGTFGSGALVVRSHLWALGCWGSTGGIPRLSVRFGCGFWIARPEFASLSRIYLALFAEMLQGHTAC